MAETITYYRGPWQWVADDDVPHWAPPAGCVGAIDLRSLPEMSTPGKSTGSLSGVGLFAVRGTLASEFDAIGYGAAHDVKASRKIRDAIPARRGFQVQGDDLLSLARSLLMDGADPTGQEFAKPLIPGADGKIRFHLGPLCTHRERKESSLKSTYWSNVRDVLRADFAEFFRDAKSGRLSDPQQHRRVLDATCEKYGLEDWRELVPAVLVKDVEGRLPHATTYSDNFNRADATGLGASWGIVIGSGCDIVSNRARGTNAAAGSTRVRYGSDLSSSDNYSQCGLVTLPASDGTTGVVARFPSSADSGYAWTYRSTTSPRRRLIKFVSATPTVLTSDNIAPGASTQKSEANGSSIKAYVDGAEVTGVATTDTSISAGLRCGILALQHTTLSLRSVHDDFVMADLSAPPPGIKYTQLEKGIRGLNRGTYTQPGAG